MKKKLKPDRKGIYYVLLLILVSLIITAIFLYTYQEKNRELEVHKKVLMDRLAETLADYKSMKTANDSLQQIIDAGENQVVGLMDSLRLESSDNYERLLSYERKFFAMERRLRDLQGELDSLLTVNDSLSQENTVLADKANQLTEVNQQLEQKIAEGSELRINSFRADGINRRLDGEEEVVNGNYWVDFVRVCFNVESNDLSSRGKRTVYLRVVTPDGKVMKGEGSNPVIPIASDPPLFYTQKHSLDYVGEAINDCFEVYRKKFPEGRYNIELYVDGRKMANAELNLD